MATYLLMSETYAAMGRFSEALEAHQEYERIRNKIFTEENSRNIAEMQARFEAEQRQKEIELLILVVDDDPINLQVLRNYLAVERFDLTLASSGEEALRLLDKETFDLVLLDVMMPRLSGYEVCRDLRESHPLEKLPVIFLTAKSQDADVVSGMALGANDYLTKPISKDRLLARVRPQLQLLAANRNLELKVQDRTRQIEAQQSQLVQSEKMAALGGLVAGVAHEINNPVNFISSGVPSLRRDVDKLATLVPETQHDEGFEKLRRRIAKLLEAIGDGARRTTETVQDLRSFARLDEAELKVADLQAALDSTLTLLHHQIKDRIEVVRKYGEIPPVECNIGQLNQVFMNLLINAAQAIDGGGTITITTTRKGDDRVCISIRDSGSGMTREVREKIFDPFFTTKPVGQGTGLGLSISHGIVDQHRGILEVESEPGKGSELTLILPLCQETG